MWQSQVKIEHYSVAYFDCVIMFKALQDRTSFKGGAHTHSVDSWTPDKGGAHTHSVDSWTPDKGGAHTHSVDSWTPDKSTECI